MNKEDVIKKLESVGYLLRGMSLDPSIPKHAKLAMEPVIQEVEEMAERLTAQEEPDEQNG